MAEGILTVPPSHHSIYSYFRLTSGEPPPVYMAGVDGAAYWVRKGSKQGCPQGQTYFCYGAAVMLRTMALELSQDPKTYVTLTLGRSLPGIPECDRAIPPEPIPVHVDPRHCRSYSWNSSWLLCASLRTILADISRPAWKTDR